MTDHDTRTPADIASLRRAYRTVPLEREHLDPDPVRQFHRWLGEAMAAGSPEANAMAIATADPAGQPSLRMVLLKHFDAAGFVFYTNLQSRKAREIDANPQAALLFYWPEVSRQVRVTGPVSRTTTAETLRYFLSRPRDSQVGAWTSPQSAVIETRSALEQKFERLKAKFAAGDVPLPDFWGGFRVAPEAVEFWQARDNRLHDRFVYRRDGDGWSIDRLAP
jgi:pyridoxamine 5'-phosphate oxidase